MRSWLWSVTGRFTAYGTPPGSSGFGNRDILLVPVSYGDHRSWWLDGDVHLPGQVEMVDKRPVLVADPESIIPEDQGLRIQCNPRTSITGTPKAVPGELGCWEIRKAGKREGSGGVKS